MESGSVKMPFEIEFSEGNRLWEAALKSKNRNKNKHKLKGIIAKVKRDRGRGVLKTLDEQIVLSLAYFFDIFETSGTRIVVGYVLGRFLACISWVMEKLGVWGMIGC